MTAPADEYVTEADHEGGGGVAVLTKGDLPRSADPDSTDTGDPDVVRADPGSPGTDSEDSDRDAAAREDRDADGYDDRDADADDTSDGEARDDDLHDDDLRDDDLREDEYDDEFGGPDGESDLDDDDADRPASDEDGDVPAPTGARIPPARAPARVAVDDPDYPDEYDDFVPSRRGRGGYDPEADAIARAARYTFRQRAVLALLLAGILCGGLGVALDPMAWWGSGLSAIVLVTYLAYLRKQVRMEEDIRRRRSSRLSRGSDAGDVADPRHAEQQARRAMDRDTARSLRRRSTLLGPDDEAPDFHHLEAFDPATARALRRASETGMRRAAGE